MPRNARLGELTCPFLAFLVGACGSTSNDSDAAQGDPSAIASSDAATTGSAGVGGSGGTSTGWGGGVAGGDSVGSGGSPASKMVHWQVNSDWTEVSVQMREAFFKATLSYPLPPDLLAIQQQYAPTVCGSYDARDQKTGECTQGDQPGTYLEMLHTFLGPDFKETVGYSAAVFWRGSRFKKVAWFSWSDNDADVDANGNDLGKCGDTGPAHEWPWALAVLLRDTRDTPDGSDDKYVVLGSMHKGNVPGCIDVNYRYFDEQVKQRWETGKPANEKPAFVFMSGDMNTRVDTTSTTEASRRAEVHTDCWWRRITQSGPIPGCDDGFSDFYDVIRWTHDAGAPYSSNKPICSQQTFLNIPGANYDNCDAVRASSLWQRIDYTFLRGTSALTENIVKAETDKGDYNGTKYAGHRAIRAVVAY